MTDRIAAMRRYADALRAAANAYLTAANAPGMGNGNKARREAANYLTNEADRLMREASGVDTIANEWEAR